MNCSKHYLHALGKPVHRSRAWGPLPLPFPSSFLHPSLDSKRKHRTQTRAWVWPSLTSARTWNEEWNLHSHFHLHGWFLATLRTTLDLLFHLWSWLLGIRGRKGLSWSLHHSLFQTESQTHTMSEDGCWVPEPSLACYLGNHLLLGQTPVCHAFLLT